MMDSPKVEQVPSVLVEEEVEKPEIDVVLEPADERRGWSYDDSIDMLGFPVRVFIKGGQTQYVNKDLCIALDYRNSRKALDHVLAEDVTQIYILDQHGTYQLTNVLTLRGLLTLILSCTKSEAHNLRIFAADVLTRLKTTGKVEISEVHAAFRLALPDRAYDGNLIPTALSDDDDPDDYAIKDGATENNNEDEDKDADEPVVKTHMSGLKQQRVAHYCL